MKPLALLFLTLISVPFLILYSLGFVAFQPTIVALIFSVIVFLVVANHNSIEIRYKDAVLKTFKADVSKIKERALLEIEANLVSLRYDLEEHMKKTKSDIDVAIKKSIDGSMEELNRGWRMVSL